MDIFFTKWQVITAGKESTRRYAETGWVFARPIMQNPFEAARRVPGAGPDTYLSSSRLSYQLSSKFNENVQDAAVGRPYISISHLSPVEFN